MKIAMWSGPRNLSTAMMYSFGNRSDFTVYDEPFYAAYLLNSGESHPMRKEIISAGETDLKKLERALLETGNDQHEHVYVKHMAHHLLSDFPLKWANNWVNVHLIRHPARVVASYIAKRQKVSLEDIGFRQQHDIFERLGGVVIDSLDIRENPVAMLKSLCHQIGLRFDDRMLSWPKGGHASDGIWASHWYGAVHQSTGFAGAEGPLPVLTGEDGALVNAALPFYKTLREKALQPIS